MNKEELYKLTLDSYHEYPLLAELMAIRDERFKDEQQDSMLCVNGYISIDTLNNYVKLQQENKKLKMINEEYERLNKGNYRGFKIINVQEYDIYELLSYKNNWNKLKKWLEKELGDRINPNKDKWLTGVYDAYRETIDKMQELERGVSDVED